MAVLLKKLGFEFDILKNELEFDNGQKKIQEADLLISGAGKPNLIENYMIKDGVFLIDMGTSSENGVVVGDISHACLEKASYFAQTPGGVGPITTAIIFQNLKKLLPPPA